MTLTTQSCEDGSAQIGLYLHIRNGTPSTTVPRAYIDSTMTEMDFPAKIQRLWKKVFQNRLKIRLTIDFCGWTFHIQKKVVFFQNLDISYRKSYSKFDEFWWLSVNLVVFYRYTEMWSVQVLESIVRRFFYRFGKTFCQSCCIFDRKSISAIVQTFRDSQPHDIAWFDAGLIFYT